MSIMPNYIITSNSSPDQFTLFDCRTCINPIWIDENVISKTWYRYNVNINQFSVSLHRKMVCLYFDCTCKRITSMMRALCSVCALVSVSVWYCLKISIFITSIVWFASFVILNWYDAWKCRYLGKVNQRKLNSLTENPSIWYMNHITTEKVKWGLIRSNAILKAAEAQQQHKQTTNRTAEGKENAEWHFNAISWYFVGEMLSLIRGANSIKYDVERNGNVMKSINSMTFDTDIHVSTKSTYKRHT